MARHPTPAPKSKEPEINERALREDVEASNQVAAISQVAAEAHALGAALGSAMTAQFFTTVGNSVLVSQFEKVKKSKAWQFLPNPKSPTHRNFESLEEYCQVAFGKSYTRLQELAGNMRLLGQEGFEQAEHLGLRQADFYAIKALPAPDQELVRRAVDEATSRDEVIDLVQELAARHSKELQALEEAQAELKAKDQVLADKNVVIDKLRAQAKRVKALPPDQVLEALLKEVSAGLHDARGAVIGHFRQGLLALQQHHETNGGDSLVAMAGMVAQLQADVTALREEFSLPEISADATPEWLTSGDGAGTSAPN